MNKINFKNILSLNTGLFMLFFATSCENLPWDKKEDTEVDKEKLFTNVAPEPVKPESIESETVTSLPVPEHDTERIQKTFPPSNITPPKPPPKAPPFYEKFLKEKDGPGEKRPFFLSTDETQLYNVIDMFAKELKFSYNVDPAVTKPITLKICIHGKNEEEDKPIMMTERAIWQLFDQILWMGGAYASVEGQIIQILPFNKMPKDHHILTDKPANVAVRLISVKNIAASVILSNIQDFLTEGAKATEITGENTILIVEDPENIDKIEALIEQLDKRERALWPRAIVRCTNVSASRIKSELEGLLPVLGFNVTVDQMAPEPGSIHLSSVERLQVVVASAANEEAIEVVKKWIKIMDRTDVGEQERVYIYKVVNSTSDELLQALGAIFTVEGTSVTSSSKSSSTNSSNSGNNSTRNTASRSTSSKSVSSSSSSSESGPANVFEVPVKIFADGKHNRLVIRTTPRTYAMIKALLARIDSMPAQVLMQIMIAEATLDDSTEFGLEFSGKGLKSNKYDGIFGNQFSGLTPSKPVDSTDQGFQYLIQSKTSGDKLAYIRALAGRGNTKILSSPQILAVSGTEASIDVARDIPTVTRIVTDTTNTSTSNEVEYRKVGVLLKLTPIITEGGLISLDIDQEISQQGNDVTVAGTTYPSFIERKVVTTLAIRNKGTIVVGGIIDELKQDNSQNAPLINKIPFLKDLLGYTDKQDRRIELLMMLTGTIVNEKTDLQKMIQRYKKSIAMFKEFKKESAAEKDD